MRKISTYASEFTLPAPIEATFELFSRPSKLNALTPRWFDLRPEAGATDAPEVGSEIPYRLRWRGLPMRWTSRIVAWDAPRLLTYEQARGPYREFRHEHHFFSTDDGTRVVDRVHYRSGAGSWIDQTFVRRDLQRIFAFRADRARQLLSEADLQTSRVS